VPIERCVVIEDSPTGVASGQASGAFVLAVPHLVAIPEHARRHVVTSLDGVTLAHLRDWASLAG
jgi:beta-phosphoglucomutase-like phosphatase (HAD superfamily)